MSDTPNDSRILPVGDGNVTVKNGASGAAIIARDDGKLSICGLRHLRVAPEGSAELSWSE